MELGDYVQPGEKIYARTTTKTTDDEDTGKSTLACTDTRLIHLNGDDITDIDINSIEVIEYTPRHIPWRYIAGSVLSLILGFAVEVILRNLEPLEGFPTVIVPAMGVFVAVAFLIDAYRMYGSRLEVRTGQVTCKFIDGDFEDFPHAIRGAST